MSICGTCVGLDNCLVINVFLTGPYQNFKDTYSHLWFSRWFGPPVPSLWIRSCGRVIVEWVWRISLTTFCIWQEIKFHISILFSSLYSERNDISYASFIEVHNSHNLYLTRSVILYSSYSSGVHILPQKIFGQKYHFMNGIQRITRVFIWSEM